MTDHGLFSGTSVTTFGPGGTMTRGMLWTVLARIDGQDTGAGKNWYDRAQAWVIAKGISDGSNPNGNINREQLAVMLYRFTQYRGADTPVSTDKLSGILDSDRVSKQGISAMCWAVDARLIQGYNNRLNPRGNATRAQVAEVMYRLIQKLGLAKKLFHLPY